MNPVVKTAINNMTIPSYVSMMDEEDKNLTLSRLYDSGHVTVTDLIPLVFNNGGSNNGSRSGNTVVVLAIARLGGYVELIPLPDSLLLDNNNRGGAPRQQQKQKGGNNIPNLSIIMSKQCSAFSTRNVGQLDIMTLDAYHRGATTTSRRSMNDDDEEEDNIGGNKAQIVLVASGRYCSSSNDGRDTDNTENEQDEDTVVADNVDNDREVMTFWGISTTATTSNGEEPGAAVIQVKHLDRYILDDQHLGPNVSLFVTNETTCKWFLDNNDNDGSFGRLNKRRKVSSMKLPCAITTVCPPIGSVRFTPSIQNGKVLLAALDYNGGITIIDCTNIMSLSSSSSSSRSKRSEANMHVVGSREENMIISREQGSMVGKQKRLQSMTTTHACQIEWWSDVVTSGCDVDNDGSSSCFTLATYATLTKNSQRRASKSMGIIRLQQWTMTTPLLSSDELIPPNDLCCLPLPNNASIALFPPMSSSSSSLDDGQQTTLPFLQLSTSSNKNTNTSNTPLLNNQQHQLTIGGIRKFTNPNEIITTLLHRGEAKRALEVVRNFGNAWRFGGRIMDECHIQLWESQCDVQALKLISNDGYVIDQVMKLKELKYISTAENGNRMNVEGLTLQNLVEVFKEGLARCSSDQPGDKESQVLSNVLRILGTFILLVNQYTSIESSSPFTTTDEVSASSSSSSSMYTKRFLYEFQHMSLLDIASSAAIRGDVDALSIVIVRHYSVISTCDRLKVLNCIPLEIDIAEYAHLLPCLNAADMEENLGAAQQLFLPRSGEKDDAKFMTSLQLFTYLSGKLSLDMYTDNDDRDNVMQTLEQDTTTTAAFDITRNEISSWYLQRALGTHCATGQVTLMKEVCEAGLIRLGFVSFTDEGAYKLSGLISASTELSCSAVSKLSYLYYAASFFSLVLQDKLQGSLSTSGQPLLIEAFPEWKDLFASVIHFCSMDVAETVPFIIDNSDGAPNSVAMFQKHVVNFVDGSKCFEPMDNEKTGPSSSAKTEDLASLIENDMMNLCIDKVMKVQKGIKARSRDDRSFSLRFEESLSVCFEFASYVSNRAPSDGDVFILLLEFAQKVLHATLKVVKGEWGLMTRSVMDKLWSIFELLPFESSTKSESEEHRMISGLYFKLAVVQLCCKWHGHSPFPSELWNFLNTTAAVSISTHCVRDICVAGSHIIAFMCGVFCDITARMPGPEDNTNSQISQHELDLLLDFISDVEEFDKRFFSSGIQQSGCLGNYLLSPLLSQHSFVMLKHLLRLRPEWFSQDLISAVGLSFIRGSIHDNKHQVAFACQETLAPFITDQFADEFEHEQRMCDAKQFVAEAMRLDQTLLDKLFSTNHSAKPISLIYFLLEMNAQVLLLGCEFWSDEVSAANACTDAALYFASQILADKKAAADEETSHVLPPMPGALVMQLANIIGLNTHNDLLLVKRCMVDGALKMGLGQAAVAICYSMLCDAAILRRDAVAITWARQQELQVVHCVVAVTNSQSFHNIGIKKELCSIALQLFSVTDSPMYHLIIRAFSNLEYELLVLEMDTVTTSKGTPNKLPGRADEPSDFLVFKAAGLLSELVDHSESNSNFPRGMYENNFYQRSLTTIFSEVKQSSGDDLLNMLSLTGTVDEESKSKAIGEVLLDWVVNEAMRERDSSSSSLCTAAANIWMMIELGSSCLAEFQEHEAAILVMNRVLEDFTSKGAILNLAPHHSIQPDTCIVQKLMSSGYGWNASRRAVVMTNNAGYREALAWAVGHFEDEDFDAPLHFLHSDSSLYADQRLVEMTGKLLRLAQNKIKEKNPRSHAPSVKQTTKKLTSVKPKDSIILKKKQFVSKIPVPSPTSKNLSPISPSSSRATKPVLVEPPALPLHNRASRIPSPTPISPSSSRETNQVSVKDNRLSKIPSPVLKSKISTPTSVADRSQDDSLSERADVKKQILRGKAKLETQKLSLDERKKLALQGKKLLDAARKQNKKVLAPPTTITTSRQHVPDV